MRGKLASFLLLAALLKGGLTQTSIPKVGIYYETFNEHVRKFFVDQLVAFDSNPVLNSIVELKFYPYGNSTWEEGSMAKCSNGETQCLANSVHMCHLGNLMSEDNDDFPNDDYKHTDYLPFARCFFKNRFAMEDVGELAKQCGVNKVDRCVKGSNSDYTDLIKYMKERTSKVQLNKGLAIDINGVQNAAAESDLVGEICKLDGLASEDFCKNYQKLDKIKLAVYYEAFNLETSKYFSRQLASYYHVLEDFVDIELVPYGNIELNNYQCSEKNKAVCQSTMFQALVVDKYLGTELTGDLISGANRAVNFVNCLFHQDTSANVFKSLEKCAGDTLEADEYRGLIDEMKLTSDTLKRVMDSMKTKTQAVSTGGKLSHIPFVTINGAESYNAFNDLVGEMCRLFKGDKKPSICKKVKVDVLYEPLDHKTRTLFLEEMKPLFENLHNVIDFNFVPAGKTKKSENAHGYTCPSGKDQCDEIVYQACIIDNYWNDGADYADPVRQEVFEAIHCMFKNKQMLGVTDNAAFCSELIEGDVWHDLLTCFKQQYDSLLSQNVQNTDEILHGIGQQPEDTTFPVMVYENGTKFESVEELKAKICSNFDDYHRPDFCDKMPAKKVSLRTFYQSDSELSKYFFTTQYDPWLLYLEEMAAVELIPGGNFNNESDGNCESYEADSVCFANKLQAVVIDEYSKNTNSGDWVDGSMRVMRFLSCVFSHPKWRVDFYVASEFCAEEKLEHDDWNNLLVTAKSEVGAQIYARALAATSKLLEEIDRPAFDLLPWVTIESETTPHVHSKRAVADLLQTVCTKFEGEKPLECTPVNVEVFYSGFNPQSRRFFLEELVPVFRNMRERIHLELIPYGVPKKDDENCTSNACKFNKLNACAITRYFDEEKLENSIQWDGKNQTLMYIECMFKNEHNFDSSELSEQCANKLIVMGAEEIRQCANTQEGVDALNIMKTRTESLFEDIEYAPWIVINGVRVALAESDLKTAVCNALVGDMPDYCTQTRAKKVALQVHYSALDDNSMHYFLSELYPNYRSLEGIVDLDLVPLGMCEVLKGEGADDYIVICPNGDEETHNNLIHACLIEEFWDNDENPISDNDADNEYDGKIQIVEFMKCYFESSNYPGKPTEAAETCVENIFGDIWGTIHACVSGHGKHALKRYQDEKVDTLLPHLTYTPWITVDGVHNYAVENHIKRTVCDAYKGREKPLNCYDAEAATDQPVVDIHYEIDDVRSVDFFSKFLRPEKVVEIAQVMLVPFGRSSKDNCKNDKECHKYIEHACLIEKRFKSDPVRTLKAIACTFEKEFIGQANNVNSCVEREFEQDIWPEIHGCTETDGQKLLETNFELANVLTPKISHVPWIVINNEHNLEAETDLPDELCSVYYPTDKPESCKVNLLPVGVFYQTRDQPSGNFFQNELAKNVEYLNELAKFDFVPYGKTTQNNDGSFTCPAGEDQCHANILHVCVVDVVANASRTETDQKLNQIRIGDFLVCSFSPIQPDGLRTAMIEEKCAENHFVTIPDIWRKVHDCVGSGRGDALMNTMKDKTVAANIGTADLPFISIDSKPASEAKNSFFQVLCNRYDILRPALCRTLQDFGVKTGIFFSGNQESKDYFVNQIAPIYSALVASESYDDEDERMYRLISPELVPYGNTKYDPANPTNPFTCTGQNECFINRFFACAIAAHGREPRAKLHLMEFAVCFFNNPNSLTEPVLAAQACTDQVWTPDPFVELEICAKSEDPQDHKKLLMMKSKTENNYPALPKFPSVTIENIYHSEASGTFLLAALCDKYKGIDIPEKCKSVSLPPPPSTTTPVPPPTTTPAPGSGNSSTQAPDEPSDGTTTEKPGNSAFTQIALSSSVLILISLISLLTRL